MDTTDPLLKRARKAYELGRLRRGLALAALTVPLVMLSVSCGAGEYLACALELGLVAVMVLLVWRGEGFGAGAVAGLVAGAVPFTAGLGMRFSVHPPQTCATCQMPFALCFTSTFVFGLVAGGMIAVAASRLRPEWRSRAIASAVPVAALVGALGCAFFGMSGVLGLWAGVALAGTPVLIHAAARRG